MKQKKLDIAKEITEEITQLNQISKNLVKYELPKMKQIIKESKRKKCTTY